MPNSERTMLSYVHLAALAEQKQQRTGRDKFLVLAAAAACRVGWPAVAERCRELILANNPRHRVSHFESFVEALRSKEFSPLLKQLDRFCGSERAEFLLAELGIDPEQSARNPSTSAGDYALQLLFPDSNASTTPGSS